MFREWETSFANYTSDTGLVPKTQKMKNLNVLKANTLIKKWVMELSRGLKRRNQMVRKPLKCSAAFDIQKRHVKMTWRSCLM